MTRDQTYDDFLEAILTFESDIDPDLAKYYDAYYDQTSEYIQYQQVQQPGVPTRQRSDGTVHVDANLTIKEFFTRLGVDDIYVRGTEDRQVFRAMQFAVINFIGFVGYQFSEADLHDLGYYDFAQYKGKSAYYSDVPDSTWANGVHYVFQPDKDVYYTDYNRWEGKFLGKHEINSFEDFKDPTKAQNIAIDHFVNKYNGIVSGLASKGKKLSDFLGTTVSWSGLKPKVSPPPGDRPDAVTVTMSGLLAGAHLRGAEGVVAMLIDHQNPADEIGTHILQYVQDFGGYDTPFNPTP